MQAQVQAQRLDNEALAVSALPGGRAGRKSGATRTAGAVQRQNAGALRSKAQSMDGASSAPAKAGEGFAALLAKASSEGATKSDKLPGSTGKAQGLPSSLLRQRGLGGLAVNLDLEGASLGKAAVNGPAGAVLAKDLAGKGLAEEAGLLAKSEGTEGEGDDLRLGDLAKARAGSGETRTVATAPEAGAEAGKAEAAKEKTEPGQGRDSGLEAIAVAASFALPKQDETGQAPGKDAAKTPALEGAEAGDSKAEAPKLSLTDLRKKDHRVASDRAEAGADQAGQQGAGPSQGNSQELDLDLGQLSSIGQGGQRQDSYTEAPEARTAPARDFSQVLAERLQDAWNGDIVKSAQVVLKDGDTGTIRLRLHPDNLGGVKIELHVAENSISGRIVVESDEARNAFERNMAQLQDAFRQGGFESASLDVQVGGQAAGGQGGSGAGDGPKPFWSERRGVESLAKAVPETGPVERGSRTRTGVDLLA